MQIPVSYTHLDVYKRQIYGNYIVVDPAGNGIAARREIRLSPYYLANGFLTAASCTLFFRRCLLDEGILRLSLIHI